MEKVITTIFKENTDSVLFAYLFGSHAQDTTSKNSDIDVAVFLKEYSEKQYFDIKIDLYLKLTRALKRNDIDLIILNTCKNYILLNNIIHHGNVVYCRDNSMRIDFEQKILHRFIDFKHQRYIAMGV